MNRQEKLMAEYSQLLTQITSLTEERELAQAEIERLEEQNLKARRTICELLDKKRRIEDQLYNSQEPLTS